MDESVGWFIVVGLGMVFAGIISAEIKIEEKYLGNMQSSEGFNTAEAHTISDPKIRSEVVTYMMDLRYKLHELLDDTIHFERVTLKKNLKL